MLGGTGKVTLNVSNVSDVMIGGCDGLCSAVLGVDGSGFGDRVVRRNCFCMDGWVGVPRRNMAGRRNLDERKLYRGRSDGIELN